jgi:hypothetical protein
MRFKAFIIVSLFSSPLLGQVYPPDTLNRINLSHGAVPVCAPETGTVHVYALIDSFALLQKFLEIKKAEATADQLNVLHRLMPSISFSASYGIGNLVFIDPSTTAVYNIPKDSYRLSLSLSLSDIFKSYQREQALLQIQSLHMEYQHMKYLQQASQLAVHVELMDVEYKLQTLDKQETMMEDLQHFNELRFEQGKIEYDVLLHSKIEVMNIQAAIHNLKIHQAELQLKYREGQ